jgi:hypothetical protein
MSTCRATIRPVTSRRKPRGFVLILTLMVLIVLATLTYQITVRLADRRRADDYLIYYQGARYACDSALKYALATTQILDPNLSTRIDQPDFSDLFRMTDDQVDEMLQLYAEQMNAQIASEQASADSNSTESGDQELMAAMSKLFGSDANSADISADAFSKAGPDGYIDANDLVIPGPYGPPWPLVIKPIEFEIGTSKVTITIEDENAKLPLVWLTSADKQVTPVTTQILQVYCAWYGIADKDVEDFRKSLEKVAEIKAFSPAAVVPTAQIRTTALTSPAAQQTPTQPVRTARGTAASAKTTAPTQVTTQTMRSGVQNISDYSRLMKSTYISADWLTIPTIESATRQEYPLKYLGVWGSSKVNINTAPRHVLEAAFAYGGDGDKIAEAIIVQRQEKPFATIDDFRRKNIAYGGQISKAQDYITTQSDIFTIRITATNGPARCSAVAAVMKVGTNVTKINAVFQ